MTAATPSIPSTRYVSIFPGQDPKVECLHSVQAPRGKKYPIIRESGALLAFLLTLNTRSAEVRKLPRRSAMDKDEMGDWMALAARGAL